MSHPPALTSAFLPCHVPTLVGDPRSYISSALPASFFSVPLSPPSAICGRVISLPSVADNVPELWGAVLPT